MPLDATMAPASFDPETRTVEAVIATTYPVMRRDARGIYSEVLDFSTLDLSNATNLRVLDSHRTASVRDAMGTVEAVRVEGDKLIAKLRLSAADDVAPVLQRIADGTIRGVSIGYRVKRWSEQSSGGTRTRRPMEWELTEITLTSNPADPAATLRQKEATVPNDVIDTTPADEAETTRRTEIRSLVRFAGLEPAIADDLIDAGADLTRAKAEIFDAQQNRQRSAPIIRSHAPANDDPAVITRRQTDAVAYRMAGGELPEDARQYVNLSLRDMASESLAREGISTRGMSADEVFTRAAHTSSDFPLVVSNAANKVALDTYKAAESPLKSLCRQKTLANFKESIAIRLGEMGRLEPLNEDGEIKATSRAENGESMRLKTFARGLTVTRELLINDDLNMLGDMTAALGEAAAQTEADELVKLLIDNPAMSDGITVFDDSRGNVHDVANAFETSGGAQLAIAAARKAMRKRTGLDGKTLINVSPRYLLVGPDIEDEAEKALAEIYPATSADVNTMAGKLVLLVEPRITDSTGFVFADPARLAAMQYAYLSAAQGVQIQRTEAWDTLGLKFRAFLDFGCGWLDWRGAHKVPAE
ncbi:prohead protease/major capsid protein fusion protein [Sulfitobacter guttiformis]|uniref:HK97 family phage prohead protease n=1 Tax=Sulfitobacter guttiformis TaxID=74349 RepID=A0A420DNY0_9RHOB|nr:prohead protease/major capsid protein fusion protein [Sulfitobacter guttiformis]KIN73263.1 Peptidase U35 phage prohead HK97 [Sulfitobacter guttiformis KCTC 32187]RKE95935.1 HK97 family phage prohead protease [Sulfitobacter guttiformis]